MNAFDFARTFGVNADQRQRGAGSSRIPKPPNIRKMPELIKVFYKSTEIPSQISNIAARATL
jgi:hypothetical protein